MSSISVGKTLKEEELFTCNEKFAPIHSGFQNTNHIFVEKREKELLSHIIYKYSFEDYQMNE